MVLQAWLVGSHTSGAQHGWVELHAALSTLVHWLTQVQLVMVASHGWLICALFTQLFVESQHAFVVEQAPPRSPHAGATHEFVVVSHV